MVYYIYIPTSHHKPPPPPTHRKVFVHAQVRALGRAREALRVVRARGCAAEERGSAGRFLARDCGRAQSEATVRRSNGAPSCTRALPLSVRHLSLRRVDGEECVLEKTTTPLPRPAATVQTEGLSAASSSFFVRALSLRAGDGPHPDGDEGSSGDCRRVARPRRRQESWRWLAWPIGIR